MTDKWVSKCGLIELRLGKWQDVLNRGRASAIVTDPPYSERTHKGQRSGSAVNAGSTIAYNSINKTMCAEFVQHWGERCEWLVCFSDFIGACWWFDEMERSGRYVFTPVVWVKPNAPRFTGDGPASTCDYLTISRPPKMPTVMGSRPGHYIVKRAPPDGQTVGRKDLGGMAAIVRDYSAPGDLVCDPFAGSGTTLLAAAMNGRRAIGCEADRDTFEKAVERMSKGYTRDLWTREANR